MAKVSLNQAAKDTGVSLPTLSRWRKFGKISAEKTSSGGYLIDTSEYDRINELRKQSSNMKHNVKEVTKEFATLPETPNETRVLQVEVNVLRERMKDKDQIIEDLREDRDEWKKQAQTLLLQNTKPVEEPVVYDEKGQVSETAVTETILKTIIKRQDMITYGVVILSLLTLGVSGGMYWLSVQADKNTLHVERETNEPVKPATNAAPGLRQNSLSIRPRPLENH